MFRPRSNRLRPSLAGEIAVVLAVKLMALAALYLAFFGPSHRVAVTAERTAAVLLAGAGNEEQTR
jgi:hypothetical protein